MRKRGNKRRRATETTIEGGIKKIENREKEKKGKIRGKTETKKERKRKKKQQKKGQEPQ